MITVTVIIGSKLFKKTIKHMVKFSKAFETWLIALSFAKMQKENCTEIITFDT